MQDGFAVSEHAACRATGVARTSVRYRSVAAPQGPLWERLRELARTRVAYWYGRLHVLLRREGWRINHKRVHRLYREKRLPKHRKRPKRRRSAVTRTLRPIASAPNERWAMDFIHDVLADGSTIRVLSVIDCFTRECLALVPARRVQAADVAAHLSRVGAARGLPAAIQCDNGTEFTSVAIDHWANRNPVRLDFSRPGKPTDNAAIERFHNSFRRECLTQYYFLQLTDATTVIEHYRREYNNDRPHSSLGSVPPSHFRAGLALHASANSTA